MALLSKRAEHGITFALGLVLTAILGGLAQGQSLDEYQVKAALLYNFVKFVEWPPQSFDSADAPIRICVLGQNRFGRSLDDTVRGKTVTGRPLVAAAIAQVRDACHCQILFISSSEQRRLKLFLPQLAPMNILTVGETDGFAEAGGVVNLKLEVAKVRFEINIEAAERANLRISSKLLSLARIVR